ncbi:MAG: recombinase family protein [Candidatus Moranbacteria bacterium]|nr:recombinase family protein [Candidatus Moranbacteria bacterium]
MKAIILARVSTEEQKDAGNSLPAQVERLKSYCKRKNFEVAETFSFDESAYKTKRDEFDKILEYLKSSKEKIAVCFDKVDRLSRNVFDKRVSQLYEKAVADEIELHFASDGQVINSNMSAVEKFQFGMSLGLAKYYSDAISDNVKRAYEQKLRSGSWIGKAPLGYKNINLDDDKKSIIPNPDNHFLVREIFELYASGKHSIKGIAEIMENKKMINTRTGTPVAPSQIEHILKNPFYYGMMRTKGVLYPHKYEPLITLALFNKVREVADSYNRQNFKRTNKPYIFRGLVKCSECGCSITPELHKGHVYYHCTNYHRNCKNVVWIREEELVEQVKPTLLKLQMDIDAIEELKRELRGIHEAEQAHYEQSVAAINKKISAIDQKMKIMYEDRVVGRITPEDYDEKVKDCVAQRKDLLEQIQEHNEADGSFSITASKVLSISSRAWELFESSEPGEKRQLLNFALQNLSLTGKTLVFDAKIPFSGILAYNSKLQCSLGNLVLEPLNGLMVWLIPRQFSNKLTSY